ncbi:sulfurtransferase [Halosimplex pelagicum]|uniref:Sulfurtransferase n=1 Tax=Halosimplex pelagicum TaxID=869886 RepID=A0A7D5TGC6_9EURY|nr:sulfurtransferase [Halosimplex pelagicum]QLH81436.1 sulfurtransferase [Halosimplex pelagicum]
MSEIVVPADWVADRRDEVRIVDTRDAWEFDGIGHVPGAVNVPFDSFRADEHAAEDDSPGDGSGGDAEESGDGQGMLPGADAFAEIMSEAGITADDRIVAYDDTHGVFAARFLVTAELYGHDPDRLHLLDGDFSAWRLDRETTSEVAEFERSEYVVDPPAETPLVGIDAVAAATDDPDTVVVDTREAWEFEEGHIPGAVRLDWRELVDDETRGLKPRAEIESLLDERGIDPDKRILLYCNTARRISHTYTVLRHLGYPDLAFYEGSLTEWKAAGRDLETGA